MDVPENIIQQAYAEARYLPGLANAMADTLNSIRGSAGVLYLPANGGSDTKSYLKESIKYAGFKLYPETGQPFRFADADIQLKLDNLDDHCQRTGDKVSLVGNCIGGMLALEFARVHPQKIRSVITLVSTFNLEKIRSGSGLNLKQVFDTADGPLSRQYADAIMQNKNKPPSMPLTAISVLPDDVVQHPVKQYPKINPLSESVLVTAPNAVIYEKLMGQRIKPVVPSHVIIPNNIQTMLCVLDRLQADPNPDVWKKFESKKYPAFDLASA